MNSGGEFTASKTAVGAIRDTAAPNSDPSIMPKRKPGDDLGAVRDTAGPKFHYGAQPKDSEEATRINGCGELSSDPCIFINEDPLIQVYYDKMKPMVVRLPKLVAIPETKPAEEEACPEEPPLHMTALERSQEKYLTAEEGLELSNCMKGMSRFGVEAALYFCGLKNKIN